jgi:hypothetical protein
MAPDDGLSLAVRGSVLVQVRAAHARRPHLDDDVVRAGDRIWELPELKLTFAVENDPLHQLSWTSATLRTRRQLFVYKYISPYF